MTLLPMGIVMTLVGTNRGDEQRRIGVNLRAQSRLRAGAPAFPRLPWGPGAAVMLPLSPA